MDDMFPLRYKSAPNIPSETENNEAVHEKFITHYKKSQRKGTLKVFLALLHTFKRPALFVLFGNLILSGLKFSAAILLFNMIRIWEVKIGPGPEGYILAGSLSLVLFCISLFTEHNFFSSINAGIQTKGLFATTIFKKMMKLHSSQVASSGYIITLASNDSQKFEQFFVFVHFLIIAPLEIIGTILFLFVFIGWKGCLAAIGSMFILIPIQISISKATGKAKEKSLTSNDSVAKTFSDLIFGISAVKYYAWEEVFLERILNFRKKRISQLRKASSLKGTNEAIFFVFPFMVTGVTIATITFTGDKLETANIFSAITLLVYVCLTVAYFAPMAVETTYEAIIASGRIKEFLDLPEATEKIVPKDDGSDLAISLRNASFSYSPAGKHGNGSRSTATSASSEEGLINNYSDSSLNSCLLQNLTFEIQKGEFCAVVGPVGSGKSSFLLACLGELNLASGKLSVNGKISYASQNPWIIGGTVRDNIVLWRDFDSALYEKVLTVSGLLKDLEGFPSGDQTFIYDGGSNISGGQRARLSLARTLYDQNADIYLLDDVFSALDNIVASQVFRDLKEYLNGKTLVLVTHQLHFLKSANRILIFEDGQIAFNGSFDNLKGSEGVGILNMIKHLDKATESHKNQSTIEQVDIEKYEEEVEVSEKQEEGKIKWKCYSEFIGAMGNVFVVGLNLIIGISAQLAMTASDRWLAIWSSQKPEQQSDSKYSIIYGSLVLSAVILAILRAVMFYFIALRGCQKLFVNMTKKLIYSPLFFFQANSPGRILNRVTKDQALMDELLTWVMFDSFQCVLLILAAIVVAGISNPMSLSCLILIGPLAWFFKAKYSKAARQIRRIESTSRSPLYNMISSSVHGLVIIRAMNIQAFFNSKFVHLANNFTKSNLAFNACARWMNVRVNLLTDGFFCFTAFLCLFLFNSLDQQQVALALMYVMQLSGLTHWCLRQISEVENHMTSAERIIEYGNLVEEGARITDTKISDEWPQVGAVEIDHMNLKYPSRNTPVLCDITCYIKPKEKVAIVGRTGAGKSSFMAALFRIVEPYPSNCIKVDGLDISKIGLKDLRSRFSMIPQEAYLFDNTLRFNLDPTGKHTDDEIWSVLESVQLKDLNLPKKLETPISSGANFSAGEKQLICLARALLRKSKVLVMDEATANIDPETTSQIQTTMAKEFMNSTIFTIAHRIATIIDYDKVILLSSGKVAEIGTPWELLQNENGYFHKLVKEMGEDGFRMMSERAMKHFLELKSNKGN